MDQDITDWDEIVSPAPNKFGKMLRVILELEEVPEDFEPDLPQETRRYQYTFPFISNLDNCVLNRCFFTTECGKMGLGPFSAKGGDVVAMIFGGPLCLVLRPRGPQYKLVGDAYVQGVMKGELAKDYEEGNIEAKELAILIVSSMRYAAEVMNLTIFHTVPVQFQIQYTEFY